MCPSWCVEAEQSVDGTGGPGHTWAVHSEEEAQSRGPRPQSYPPTLDAKQEKTRRDCGLSIEFSGKDTERASPGDIKINK